MFIYYSRLSIKERLDIDSPKPHVADTNRRCSCCKEVFVISKNFKFAEQICNKCYKIKSMNDCESGNMFVLYIDNAFYRVFTNLCYNWADRVLRSKRSLDKLGYIDVKKHNSLIELLITENTRHNNIDDNI